GGERYLVIANGANRGAVAAALAQRAAPFGAAVQDVTAGRALLAVQGPRSREILTAAGLGGVIGPLGYYRAAEAVWEGAPVVVARTGYTGEVGYEIASPAAEAPRLWQRIEAAGEPHGLALAGLAARDTLRLEAGMALYGHELTRATTPWDAGLDRFVDLEKGDFVGRAALVAARERPPRRHLTALAGQGRRAARAGYAVLADDAGTPVGQITSGALSPTLGRPIALAYVEGAAAPRPGARLDVDVRGRAQPFEVVEAPFYRRPRAAAPKA
ncbi:MAG: hypothetical protein LBT54_01180, partial [Bifidobacteriaceae bacterium]|nr:hypothetical protein [Bifidobacteriaceae bacterium]